MFSVLIPVGPAEADVRRLTYVLESLRRHERASEIQLILIDDAPSPRRLEQHSGSEWHSADVIHTPIWKRGRPDPYTAMTVGTICGLRVASPAATFVLKLDTDALVIGQFSGQLKSEFATDHRLGILGSYDRTCTGGLRDWSLWVPVLRRTTRRLSLRSPRKVSSARRLLRAALTNSEYKLGAHCLGGAYAVGPALAARHDLLDWKPWVGSGLGEDVVMGVLCAAAGLRMRSMTAVGEPFGLAYTGLAGTPEWLRQRGHSIVHAVKDSDAEVEAELRERLQAAVS
jgi:hypothetical protein